MKRVDQIYHCQMPGQVFGVWPLQGHLQIFEPHAEVQTVMITDMGIALGGFVPYIVERLIDQIVEEFHLDPGKLIWLEHYTPTFKTVAGPDFRQVTFEWRNGQAMNPQWSAIARETVQALISQELILG